MRRNPPGRFSVTIRELRDAAHATSDAESQERTMALAMLRYLLMSVELPSCGDADDVNLEFGNTTRFWVAIYRAVTNVQARQSILNLDVGTAEVLLM